MSLDFDDRIYVAGAETLIGSALLRQLARRGYRDVIGVGDNSPDTTSPDEVNAFFARQRPDVVFLAAGSCGGIGANQRYPADLCYDNLAAAANLLHAAHEHGVRRLLYFGSSCCYPKRCPQPMRVEHLGTGELEPTSAAYATAKLAGIELARAYRRQYGDDFLVAIPPTAFGIGDHVDPDQAHVVTALMARMHAAKVEDEPALSVWGTGRARRDFLFADDLADAAIFVMRQRQPPEVINLGSGAGISITELAEAIRCVVGYTGRLEFDTSRPDGAPCKVLDTRPLAELGWQPPTPLKEALNLTYRWLAPQLATETCIHAG